MNLPTELHLFPNWTRDAAVRRLRDLIETLPKDRAIRVTFEPVVEPVAQSATKVRVHAMLGELAREMGDNLRDVKRQMKERLGAPYVVNGDGEKQYKSIRDWTEEEATWFAGMLEVTLAEYNIHLRGTR